jgi:hypothetical protein
MSADKGNQTEKTAPEAAQAPVVEPLAVEEAPQVPAGKARVVVAVDFANPHRVGRTYTVDQAEAEVLVREGRARYTR